MSNKIIWCWFCKVGRIHKFNDELKCFECNKCGSAYNKVGNPKL